jgi:hypothetical protein
MAGLRIELIKVAGAAQKLEIRPCSLSITGKGNDVIGLELSELDSAKHYFAAGTNHTHDNRVK